MPNLPDLLARGYFPKELPPPFTTQNFASYITTVPLAADFAKKNAGPLKIRSSKAGRYSLARGGLLRRPLSICHPVAQFLLSNEIVISWRQIQPLVAGTRISATHPEDKSSGRAIDGHLSQNARAQQAQQKRLGKRFVLHADVSRFYSSIYTHSIPWAMHSKSISKANHSNALIGNRIDSLVRLGQDSQTIGIPIGPDTSLVIAEMIMHRCDAHLESKIAALQGFRFIDDFELSFASQAEAEHAHHSLEACLADFELALNPGKTWIRELPQPLEAAWVTKLRRAKPRSPVAQQAADLVHLFDIGIGLHKEYPGEAVLQFAISLLQFDVIHTQNWQLFQRLTMLCSLPEPACFPIALREIVRGVNSGQTVLIPEIAEIANTLIITHSPLRHSSEVANAAYACLALGLTMSDTAVDAISQCDDPVVALLALDCEQRHLTSKPLDKTLWSSHMKADELYDEFWLLSYEANIKGWLPNVGGVDFVAADQNFAILKAAGVCFYDANLYFPSTLPTKTVVSEASAPLSATIPSPSNSSSLTPAVNETVPPPEVIVPTDSASST